MSYRSVIVYYASSSLYFHFYFIPDYYKWLIFLQVQSYDEVLSSPSDDFMSF